MCQAKFYKYCITIKQVHLYQCKIYRCSGIQNTDDSPLFRYEMFIYSWLLVFRYKERETQFLLCWLFLHPPQSTPQLDWPGPESNLNSLLFSKITKISAHCFRAWCHSHPGFISYLGFLSWHLWLSYPLHMWVWAWTVPNVCAPAPALSRIVQSPTKLNDEIKWMKND